MNMPITRKKLLVGAATVLGALLLLFIFRYSFVTLFSNIFYKSDVGAQFDRQFETINPQLEDLGFTFTGSPPANYAASIHRCAVVARGEVVCSKSRHSDEKAVTTSFVSNWGEKASILDKYLSDNGWHPLTNQYTLFTLYDNPDNIGNKMVLYSHTDSRCNLMFSHNLFTATTSVEQSCSRDLTFPDIRDTEVYY